ncbi:hypothetical protein MYMAC_001182 [Corallococcus macrosporus DSM 14697]|uniref:Uncharacterized protein n=2 Tax=Corallococcus macrosporus TaxID=35 RepID=A0A250JQ27_9BACT|nr:hypothetical protein MYMAC_001182 [Corallococcus macrosporus DSM 14697]
MEMAVCMLVIIPVFLYSLFLFDLLRHMLDAQETSLTTAWDYTVLDYEKEPESVATEDGGTTTEAFSGFEMAQAYSRYMYCDHESGLDSYGPGKGPECQDDESHHTDVVAHACWLNVGGQQVYCSLDADDVGAYDDPLHQSYRSTFGRGGLIRCSARLGVQNYLLPEQFLPEFSRVRLAKEKQERANGVHNNATGKFSDGGTQAGKGEDVYLLPEEKIAILTDTWALTEHADVRPGTAGGRGMHERVTQLYQNPDNSGFTDMSSASERLVSQAISSGLLNPGLRLEPQSYKTPGDDPRNPSLAIKPDQSGDGAVEEVEQQGGRQGYFSNEWQDWENNNNQRSYEARGNWYLGCARAESC